MGFNDVLKKTFLEGISAGSLTTTEIAIALVVAAAVGMYIFCIYRVTTRKTFYSKSFNIALVALVLITAAIILTIQSSVVISLGMVGALSIVRFRTAIKDPMDLIFLFWSISIGIICGAGLFEVALLLSVFVSAIILLLELLPGAKTPMLLILNGASSVEEAALTPIIGKYAKTYKVKTQTITKHGLDVIYEVKPDTGNDLVRELSELKDVYSVSLMTHDGEVTY